MTISAQEQPAQETEQKISLELPSGRAEAWLRVPAQPARPPVVLVLANGPEVESYIGLQLQRAGIASLRLDATPSAGPAQISHAIAYLRNRSEQFPTVTVIAPGRIDGIIAARTARADGLVYVSALISRASSEAVPVYLPQAPELTERFNSELKYVLMAKLAIAGGDFDADMVKVADFAKSVRAYGRRGGSAERSAQARRSPRQVVLTNIGDVRVGIEWGSPQKRGREVWGNLVKWDAVWMPGADEATTLTTNGLVTLSAPGLASLNVPAGDHTIYTLPGAGRFELIISKDTGQFHTVHLADRDLGRLVMNRADRAEAMEGLTFALEPNDAGALFKLIWDQREYFVQVTTNK